MKKKEITFPNGNRAHLIEPTLGTTAGAILQELDIPPPRAIILNLGGDVGLDESLKPRLTQLYSRGIARAAAETEALIIDGGTRAGVMELMGQGVADRGKKSLLLGIAPAGKVTYPGGPARESIRDSAPLDPNHSHFVLVDTDEWGGKTETMFELIEALARGTPIVVILVNGGDVSKEEVLLCVRYGWPLIVMEKTGLLADEITTFIKQTRPFIEDPAMAEIIADADIQLFPLDGPVEDLKKLIIHHLELYSTLTMAWKRFTLYDTNAVRQQASFNRMQKTILMLGILATLLALSQTQLNVTGIIMVDSWQDNVFKYIIVMVPITISILVAVSNRFKSGNKWILLRASAEAIKRAIYRYRIKADVYSHQQIKTMSCEAKLAQDIEFISRHLMQTDVNMAALRPYQGPIPPKMYGAAAGDDGYSFLTPQRYITIRLGDQLNYYQLKTSRLERQLKRLHWLIYILGGAGTLLAALGFGDFLFSSG